MNRKIRKADHFCFKMYTLKKWQCYTNLTSPKLLLLMTKHWKFSGLLTLIRLMNIMKYQSECWHYVTNLLLHPSPYCSRIVLIQGLSQTPGRSQILCIFIIFLEDLNFKSFTSFSYKISLIKCMIYRSFKICNNWNSS